MTREQKLEQALRLAAQSAGFQYMTAETRNKIDTALSDIPAAPLPHDAVDVIGTLIESLEEGLMTDAGLSGSDRAGMRHQIEALTLAKNEIAALSTPKVEAAEPYGYVYEERTPPRITFSKTRIPIDPEDGHEISETVVYTSAIPTITDETVERAARALDPEIWEMDAPVPTRAATEDFHARRSRSIETARTVLAAAFPSRGGE